MHMLHFGPCHPLYSSAAGPEGCLKLLHGLRPACPPAQEAERLELERLSHQLALDRETADSAFTAAANLRDQQQVAAADLAKREAALEAKASNLAGMQAQLVAAQAAAMQQLQKLEASMKKKLEGHEKQVE